VARVLGHFFLGRDELVQVPGGPTAKDMAWGPIDQLKLVSVDVIETDVILVTPEEVEKAKEIISAGGGKKLFGQSCSACGSQALIQAGSCQVCGECGTTTGCS